MVDDKIIIVVAGCTECNTCAVIAIFEIFQILF